MKKLMILGAGSCQLNAIHRIKDLGYKPVVSDYHSDSPGKKYAELTVMADTFSYPESLEGALSHDIDGVMTTGTDQPVLTVTQIANHMGLPTYLSEETAVAVTNKKVMKARFHALDIPMVDYQLIKEDTPIEIQPPYVMKPLDSQGQRGIFLLDNEKDVRSHFRESLKYSKLDEVLLESFYKNKEVTVSGWVQDQEVTVLTITDRVTFSAEEHIGVCISHEYPTIHQEHTETLIDYTKRICKGFEIENGPIYFQFLIGDEGVKVNEIACRIGGAFEDVTIPYVTGVDILKMQIEHAMGKSSKFKCVSTDKVFSTQLFFCHSGNIDSMTPIEHLKAQDYILDAGFNYSVGQHIGTTENASQRAGYMIVVGDNEEVLVENIEKAYNLLEIKEGERNLVIRGKRFYR